jgi:hypothetical protein
MTTSAIASLEKETAMQMMTGMKLMPKTRIVLVSMVALSGLLLVNPGNTLLSKGGEAGAIPRGSVR